MTEPGLYDDMSNHDYHHNSGGVSSSTVKLYKKTGAHAMRELSKKKDSMVITGDRSIISGDRRKSAKAKIMGDYLHCAVLQPELLKSQYAIIPASLKMPTKAQIEAKKIKDSTAEALNSINVFLLANAGKITIHEEDRETAQKMADNVLNHHESMMLLSGSEGLRENSIFWWHRDIDPRDNEEFSMLAKCRPDWLTRDFNILPDLKSCRSADSSGFAKQAYEYGYHISMGMYLEGINQSEEMLNKCGHDFIDKVAFVCVENEGDHLVRVVELDGRDVEFGRESFRRLMIRANRAVQNNHPGYAGEIPKIRLPGWKRQVEI